MDSEIIASSIYNHLNIWKISSFYHKGFRGRSLDEKTKTSSLKHWDNVMENISHSGLENSIQQIVAS